MFPANNVSQAVCEVKITAGLRTPMCGRFNSDAPSRNAGYRCLYNHLIIQGDEEMRMSTLPAHAISMHGAS